MICRMEIRTDQDVEAGMPAGAAVKLSLEVRSTKPGGGTYRVEQMIDGQELGAVREPSRLAVDVWGKMWTAMEREFPEATDCRFLAAILPDSMRVKP